MVIRNLYHCNFKKASERRTEAPPEGWCTMMRLLGRERRWPGSPAASSRLAMLAACPMQMVLMGFRRYCTPPSHPSDSSHKAV